MTYKEYEDNQAQSGIQKGDLVKVTRKAVGGENGWLNEWVASMDCTVGSVSRVTFIGYGGVLLFDFPWQYPDFVLEIVEKNNETK